MILTICLGGGWPVDKSDRLVGYSGHVAAPRTTRRGRLSDSHPTDRKKSRVKLKLVFHLRIEDLRVHSLFGVVEQQLHISRGKLLVEVIVQCMFSTQWNVLGLRSFSINSLQMLSTRKMLDNSMNICWLVQNEEDHSTNDGSLLEREHYVRVAKLAILLLCY